MLNLLWSCHIVLPFVEIGLVPVWTHPRHHSHHSRKRIWEQQWWNETVTSLGCERVERRESTLSPTTSSVLGLNPSAGKARKIPVEVIHTFCNLVCI